VGQGTNDGVLEIWAAGRDHLTIRLGVQVRDPRRQVKLLPARYVRLQVASPPPRRVDGTTWVEGLVTNTGDRFDPDSPPADREVFPLGGIAPLGQPNPGTIVLDRWFTVPASPRSAPIFTLGPAGPVGGPLSFQSVPYPDPRIDGATLLEAEVDYLYEKKRVDFDREVNVADDGVWVAVSTERFFPPERASADSIVRLVP
jgi:hypothetical protein